MADAPRSREAFGALLDTLRDAAETYLHTDETLGERDIAEGYRMLLHQLSAGIEYRFEADGAHPLFLPIVGPYRKIYGDNADARYYWTRIRGDRGYRVRGRMIDETYVSFTVHGLDPDGGMMQEVLADINHTDLDVGDDGRYEIVFSPQRPEGHDGDWVALDPSAEAIITRHYFSRPVSAGADPELAIELSISTLDPEPVPPVWSDDRVAERLEALRRFVQAGARPRGGADEPQPAFVSREPNVLPAPVRFADSDMDTVGAVDIYYAMCPFALGPDQALVMEGTLPEGPFTNVVLWNRHMQTLEYRGRRSSLNDSQMQLGADRSFRIVVAGEDPGVPNWIDTEGRSVGMVFWRYLLPETEPARVDCSVVPIEELR